MSEIEAIDQNSTKASVEESHASSPSSWNGRDVDAGKTPAHSLPISQLMKKVNVLTTLDSKYALLAERVAVVNQSQNKEEVQKQAESIKNTIKAIRKQFEDSIAEHNKTSKLLHEDPKLFDSLVEPARAQARSDLATASQKLENTELKLKEMNNTISRALEEKNKVYVKTQKILKDPKASQEEHDHAEKKSLKATQHYFQLTAERDQYCQNVIKGLEDQIKGLKKLIEDPARHLNPAPFIKFLNYVKEFKMAEAEKVQADAGLVEAQKKYKEKYKKNQKTWGPVQARKARKKLEKAEENLRIYALLQEEAQNKYKDASSNMLTTRAHGLYDPFADHKKSYENQLIALTNKVEKLESKYLILQRKVG